MLFFDFSEWNLEDFRPGIKSRAHFGEQMTLAVMIIDGGNADTGHAHPFEQCGLVMEGFFTMTIGEETRTLGPGQGYFVPAGVAHGWATGKDPVRVLDLSARSPAAD
jgi:quercetin dioxygenase-like cupin family protein